MENTGKIISFLRDLAEHNDRSWFNDNKTRYDEVLGVFESFVNQLIPEIRNFDSSIDLITAKDCTFRIYRDVRFSNDKSPYKTNMGAYIAKGGRKSSWAGYYVHFEPGRSMLAGGMYMPLAEQLRKIRDEIYFNAVELENILTDEGFMKYYSNLDEEYKMTRPPKGYPSDFPHIDLLKYKSYVVTHMIGDSLAGSGDFLFHATGACKALFPLNAFLNRIFI